MTKTLFLFSFVTLATFYSAGLPQGQIAPKNGTPAPLPTWVCEVRPLLQQERGNVPLSLLLGWIKVESDGRVEEVTALNERGYFQLMKSESEMLNLQHERLTTDKSYSLRAGLQLIALYGRTVEQYGFSKSDPHMFWRMVKLVHAMGPGSVKQVLDAMKVSGVLPSSWEVLEKFSSEHRADLLHKTK